MSNVTWMKAFMISIIARVGSKRSHPSCLYNFIFIVPYVEQHLIHPASFFLNTEDIQGNNIYVDYIYI